MSRRTPFQVYLDRALSRRLRKMAERKATSQAALVRRFIEHGLAQEIPPDEDPALKIIGIGHSGIKDLSARHDDYLAEIYDATHKRPTR